MTIQRQYSLPNCTIVLEGLGDPAAVASQESRPLMSMLINAECYLSGQAQAISGGREFFESFVTAVSQYAQEVIGGFHRFSLPGDSAQLVQLRRVNQDLHRLYVQPQSPTPTAITAKPTEIDLTTVQLFDLVEAVDQFFADKQTLPDLSLKLAPLPKRYIRSSEPIAKQAVPALAGVSGLALAAAALFFVPVPSVVREPSDAISKPGTTSPTGSPTTPASPPVAGSSPSPNPSPSPTTEAASPSPTTEAASPSPTATAQADPAQLGVALTAAPAITDTAQLESLRQQLYNKLDQAWKNRNAAFVQDLVYQVGVEENGTIVGAKAVNPAALSNINLTPLLELPDIRTAGTRPQPNAIAQYKVVFTPGGVLEVAPWQQAMPPPLAGTPEITDSERLKELQPKLYDQVDQNWKQSPTFDSDLVLQMRVRADGTIVDYSPENQAATDYTQETPLPQLGKPIANGAGAGVAQESLARFKVVFKPDGKLEINPWHGRRE